ncbi:RNA exonuclease 1 homolog [Uranotaenia lowii]|uniref:RNA exonuclease 1 homolog n=1 Tax=Uranotaenia lowii TaxID=190385 RepID=UPI0024795619|nr:RNA exonuclease 1 homolog [Uranotaenia lowii]
MLPATGLFRSINCPFFEKDLCTRPFCHFRHTKPESIAPAAATYSATPKSLLNQNNPAPVVSDGPAKKKPKLEYIPMPTILAPKYTPSTKPTVPIVSGEDITVSTDKQASDPVQLENKIEEPPPDLTKADPLFDELAEITSNGHKNGPKEQSNIVPKEDGSKTEANVPEIKTNNSTKPASSTDLQAKSKKDSERASSSSNTRKTTSESSSKHKNLSSSSSSRSSSKSSSKDVKDHHKDKSNRKESERKSSSSSSKEKSRSSSQKEERPPSKSSKEKERSDKDRSKSRHKESSKDKERTSEKSNKEHSRSSDKDRHKSSQSSSKSSSKSSSSSNSVKKSSSSNKPSSCKSSTQKSSSSSASTSASKSKLDLADEIYRELLDNPPSDIDIDSDEDEVMKQCKLIFEEFESEPPTTASEKSKPNDSNKKKSSHKSGGSTSTDVELIDMFAEQYYDENAKKKQRVAHDNASKPASASPTVAPGVKKVNHVQNAMKSVYLRQELIRKQQEELAAKLRVEEEAKSHIEEETKKAMAKPVTPRLSNGSPRSPVLSPTNVSPATEKSSPVSPISTSSFYSKSPETTMSTPRSRFTPAVNVLAFQKAKEKIDHLRKLKSIGTPAQTAPKGASRVAHTVPVASSVATKTAAPVVPAKPPPPVLESNSTKISYNIRMQYYNLMIKHCLNIYPSSEDAWDRAQTEELAVMKKCSTPMIYKSSALLTINKLRKEAVDAGSETTDKLKTISHDVILAGKMGHNISWSVNKKIKTEAKSTYTIDNASSTDAYKMIYECILTEEQLQANGFPRATDVPGKAKIHTPKPSRPPNEEERYCSRCSKVFNLETYEESAVDTCNYHAKSTCYRRGFADNLHNCCQQPAGSAGCMYANYHVSSFLDYDNLTGFVKTIDPPEEYVPSKKDIFALDCEMCYTTGGLELTRVTVVDINEKTVYDALVKPTNMIVDYNTRFSGITEQMLRNTTTTLYNVQAVLLSMFNSETILIGHSLESDFKALKLIHDVVVDTSVLYPHKMGPPKKRALKTLCIENLKKIIQENDAGHDSAEDSVVCIQLIKHYLRNRIL